MVIIRQLVGIPVFCGDGNVQIGLAPDFLRSYQRLQMNRIDTRNAEIPCGGNRH